MKEQVIRVTNERENDKREELITSLCFDAMFAIQDGVDQLFLKSQGQAISICADIVLEIERRLKAQLVPVKKKIFLNSRLLNNDRYGDKNRRRYERSAKYDNKIPKILSYMDVKFYFKH
ncbi:MAG: hypothetical protein ACTSWY_01745 [Promethearchaeota archaeon]